MLILSRREAECVCLGDDVVLTVVAVGNDKVRIGVQAPSGVRILRRELDIRELDVRELDIRELNVEKELIVEPGSLACGYGFNKSLSIHSDVPAGQSLLLNQAGEPLAGQVLPGEQPSSQTSEESRMIIPATAILPKAGPLKTIGSHAAGPLRAHLRKAASNRRAD